VSFRVLLLFATLSFALAATSAWAQQPNKIPVVGVLTGAAGPNDPVVEGLRQGLRELGYVEGHTFKIEFRTAQGYPDRLPGLADELVQLKANVIVVTNMLATQAAKSATPTIPIVMVLVADPVASGLVTNLAHPGGSVTGLSIMTTELSAKRLQLLKETIPRLTRVGILWNPGAPLLTNVVGELKAAASSMSIDLEFVQVRTPEEFSTALSAVRRSRVQALYLLESPLFYVHRITLAELALKAQLPTISAARSYTDAGGLLSYGVNYVDQWRRAAGYVDKILKGAKPGDLPIEQPTQFEFVVNLRTAKALGLTIPQPILVRADEVIR
jgi:ABC-type uncharacterized transport system substrate-binding protein